MTPPQIKLAAFNIMTLDEKGGATHISLEEARAVLAEKNFPLWIRLNYNDPLAEKWLEDSAFLDSLVVANLQDGNARPRTAFIDSGLLLSLRGITKKDEQREDMIALLLWFKDNLILTARGEKFTPLAEMEQEFLSGRGPKNISQFLSQLVTKLSDESALVVEKLEERLELVEDFLDEKHLDNRTELTDIRRFSLRLRRYLTPQKEALNHLLLEAPDWLKKRDKLLIKESSSQYSRLLDDLLFILERIRVAEGEFHSILSEKMNQRMLTLTLATTLFLPLSFCTGLFGINVGGIPWAANGHGFWFFCAVLLFLVFFVFVFCRWKKWF